jgi:hypothetical protein
MAVSVKRRDSRNSTTSRDLYLSRATEHSTARRPRSRPKSRQLVRPLQLFRLADRIAEHTVGVLPAGSQSSLRAQCR